MKNFFISIRLVIYLFSTKQIIVVVNQKTIAVALNIFRLPIKDFLFEPWFKPKCGADQYVK